MTKQSIKLDQLAKTTTARLAEQALADDLLVAIQSIVKAELGPEVTVARDDDDKIELIDSDDAIVRDFAMRLVCASVELAYERATLVVAEALSKIARS